MKNRGFTLVELVVTIALLSVISTISFVSVNAVIEGNKINNCEVMVSNIETAVKEFVSDNRYGNIFNDNDYSMNAKKLIDENYLKGEIIDPFSDEMVDASKLYIDVVLNDNYTYKNMVIKNSSGEEINLGNCENKVPFDGGDDDDYVPEIDESEIVVNKVIINYNVNGGEILSTTNQDVRTYLWATSDDGIIYQNGTRLYNQVSYGSTLSSDGLINYNNPNFLNITMIGHSAVSGAEWICLSGDCVVGTTYDQATVYSTDDFCDASVSDCTVVLGVNWRVNKVFVNFNVNGGIVASSTVQNGVTSSWTTTRGIVYKNGTKLYNQISYGSSLGTNGLVNYNNSSYLNITRTGYTAVSGAEWKCLSGDCVVGTTYNHNTTYAASDFCDASSSSCTAVLGVNWKQSDSTAPTCTISATSGSTTVTATASDNVGVTGKGWSTSYDGSTTKTVSATGTVTYYVKDAAGNTGTCSANISDTTRSGGYSCSQGTYNASLGCVKSATPDYGTCTCVSMEKAYSYPKCNADKSCPCPSDYVISVNNCLYNTPTYFCPSGWTKSGSSCSNWAYVTGGYTYSCASGYTKLSDSYCFKAN